MKITKSKLKQIITEELHNILAEQDDDDPGTTRFLKPGEREAARRVRAGAETKKIDMTPRRTDFADRQERRAALKDRAMKIQDILYPDASNEAMVFTLRGYDDEANLVDRLFGFLYPKETNANPSPILMDRAEEWIATFDNPDDAYLESSREGSNEENLESFLSFIEKRAIELGREEFAKAKADAESRPARNVTVGRAATPGTPERTALDALMKAEVPPKKRR